jgi:hypothetical protein
LRPDIYRVGRLKDLNNNPDETRALDQRKRNRLAVWGSSKVGSRTREKIRKAHGQLTAGKDQKLPSNDNKLDAGSAPEDEEKATPSAGF